MAAATATRTAVRACTWNIRHVPSDYRPWWGQRIARRLSVLAKPSDIILGVAARQVGKTRVGTQIVVPDALADPEGQSLVLVPTYRLGLVQARRMRGLGEERLGGRWKKQDACLVLPNGHVIWLRSADTPDATRGLDLTGWLWVDEAALVSEDAYKAAAACLLASNRARTLITTTPRGKASWVYRLWTNKADQGIHRFLLRATDSPFISSAQLTRARASMGAGMGQQELDAVFTDENVTPFPVELVDRMLVRGLVRRGERWALGVDLAKQQDWTVCTLINEWGEAWVVDRWQHIDWPTTWRRISEIANRCAALIVLDESGGAGSATADHLEEELGKDRIMRVATGAPGVRQQLIEELQGDAQHGRLVVDADGAHAADLRHELLFLVPVRSVLHGVERISYTTSSEDDHDDTVISLALANAGRRFLQGAAEGDLSDFVRQPGARSETHSMRKQLPPPGGSWWGKPVDLGRRA